MANERKSLGRGLGSIISGGIKNPAQPANPQVASKQAQAKQVVQAQKPEQTPFGLFTEIAIDKVAPSPYQARREFSEEAIAQLADSISSEGLIQPIVVRKAKDGSYEIIAGERRFRACKKLGLKKIPACVQSASDASAAVKGLIENLQRTDLNPIEEAQGIGSLISNFKLTQESAAARLGKSRSSITNSLRLLTLPKEVQNFIASGLISQGHAKVLLGLDDKESRLILARQIIEKGLNVRATEDAVKRIKSERITSSTRKSSSAQDAVIRDLQRKISTRLNASVELKHGAKRGKIVIEYLGNDDLQRILEIIGINV